jgi:hypothetical protein
MTINNRQEVHQTGLILRHHPTMIQSTLPLPVVLILGDKHEQRR